MGRVSIRSLMAFVVVFAVGLAALRNANEIWAGLMLVLAVAAFGVAVVGMLIMRGRERAWWLGFAVFCGGYLLTALSPMSSQITTTHVLESIQRKAVGFTVVNFEVSRVDQSSLEYRVVFADGVGVKRVPDNVANSTDTLDLFATMAPANRWRTALPGTANHDQFLRVGHCVFRRWRACSGGRLARGFMGGSGELARGIGKRSVLGRGQGHSGISRGRVDERDASRRIWPGHQIRITVDSQVRIFRGDWVTRAKMFAAGSEPRLQLKAFSVQLPGGFRNCPRRIYAVVIGAGL